MMDDQAATPMSVTLTPQQVDLLDRVREKEHLASRSETLQLLLEIAFDTVTAKGTRFWDEAGQTLRRVGAYRSSNGDLWQLLHDAASSQPVVRHIPNPASGGLPSDVRLDMFLSSAGNSPQVAAIRQMLNQLDGLVKSIVR